MSLSLAAALAKLKAPEQKDSGSEIKHRIERKHLLDTPTPTYNPTSGGAGEGPGTSPGAGSSPAFIVPPLSFSENPGAGAVVRPGMGGMAPTGSLTSATPKEAPTSGSDDMSPRSYAELEKQAPQLLQLMSQMFKLFDSNSFAASLAAPLDEERSHRRNHSMENFGRDEKAYFEQTELREKQIPTALFEMHTILEATSSQPSQLEQRESVRKLEQIYFAEKSNVELSKVFPNQPALLVTAIIKSNLAALYWLIDNGAKFPLEVELMMALSAPDAFKAFKLLIQKRRKDNDNFLACFEERHTELLNKFIEQQNLRQEAAKKDTTAIVADIDKYRKTVADTVYNKYLALITTSCGDIALLKTFNLQPAQLMERMKEIFMLSVVETQGTFATIKDECQTVNSWLVHSYCTYKMRKEIKKSLVQEKLKSLPPQTQKEIIRLLKSEQACFDTILNKIKNYLVRHHPEMMQAYEKNISGEIIRLTVEAQDTLKSSPEKSIKVKACITEINIRNRHNFEKVLVPKLKAELSALHDKVYADREQLHDSNFSMESIDALVSVFKREWSYIDIASLKYFHLIHCAEFMLNDFVARIKLTYQAVLEAKAKFEPSSDDLQQVLKIDEEMFFTQNAGAGVGRAGVERPGLRASVAAPVGAGVAGAGVAPNMGAGAGIPQAGTGPGIAPTTGVGVPQEVIGVGVPQAGIAGVDASGVKVKQRI